MKYPEHEKLRAISSQSQTVGSFLDWLTDAKGATLAVRHEHSEHCYEQIETTNGVGVFMRPVIRCGFSRNELMPGNFRIQSLLAEFFEIDEEKIEQEKKAMLKELQNAQNHRA